MKTRFFIILTTFLCLLIPLVLIVPLSKAQEVKQEEKKIIASGDAKIWIEPDRARIFLGIETLSKTVDVARQENATKIQKVMEALTTLNIEDMLIKAPSYNVSLVKEPQHYATKAGRLPRIIGFQVRQDFTVLLKNEDPLILSKDSGQVIDTALNNGVNIIQRVNFFKEDDSKDKRNAMSLAVTDAISNAKTIADAAGVSIKDYILINSYTGYLRPPVVNQMRQAFAPGEAGGVPTTLVAGKIAITCKVQLQCTIK